MKTASDNPSHNAKAKRRRAKPSAVRRTDVWSAWDLAILGGLLALSTRDADSASRAVAVAAALTNESRGFGKAFEALGDTLSDARQIGEMASDLHIGLAKSLGSGTTGVALPPGSDGAASSGDDASIDGIAIAIANANAGRDYGKAAESIRSGSDEVASEIRRLFDEELKLLTEREKDEGDETRVADKQPPQWLPALALAGGGGGGGGSQLASFFGAVIDGYVSGAKVFIDRNGNAILGCRGRVCDYRCLG